mmetsp:Transcript_63753/g.132747  ORF Transcript_63753/g.132747 Transcript_63753/m.132747 type:complete len:272 (-) Transcript_63753:1859-2674(-)
MREVKLPVGFDVLVLPVGGYHSAQVLDLHHSGVLQQLLLPLDSHRRRVLLAEDDVELVPVLVDCLVTNLELGEAVDHVVDNGHHSFLGLEVFAVGLLHHHAGLRAVHPGVGGGAEGAQSGHVGVVIGAPVETSGGGHCSGLDRRHARGCGGGHCRGRVHDPFSGGSHLAAATSEAAQLQGICVASARRQRDGVDDAGAQLLVRVAQIVVDRHLAAAAVEQANVGVSEPVGGGRIVARVEHNHISAATLGAHGHSVLPGAVGVGQHSRGVRK